MMMIKEIKNMMSAQTDKILGALWNGRMDDLLMEVEGFEEDQRTKFVFMDTILSGGKISETQMHLAATLHGPIAVNPILTKASLFFEKECHGISMEDKKKEACDKLLFAYTGLATIGEMTLTKLASVLAVAKQNTMKDGVLTVVDGNKRKSRKFLEKIFVESRVA